MFLHNLQGKTLTAAITITCGTGFLLFGYDQGVFGGLLSNNAFLRTFGNPNATIQGQIVSTYDIGCIFGAISSIFFGDRLGRRRSIILGCCLVIIGGTIQTASYHLPQMIIGRIVAGLGTGMNTTAIPMWQSETSQAKDRGKLIVIQLVLVLGGIVITNWMNFGFTFAPDTQVSWRFPLAFQDFFAILTIIFISFLPESPRWLVMKGRRDEARVIIARLLSKPQDDQQVVDDLSIICDSVARAEEQGNFGWREVFRNGKKQTFRRILLGAGPSFMQQMGGTNVVAYYLPVVLVRSFGFSNRLSLILSACDSISLMFWGSMATFLIDRVGRKNLMLMGAFTQSICFCMAGMGLSFNSDRGSILAVTFIFLYYVFYVSAANQSFENVLTATGTFLLIHSLHVPFGDQFTAHAKYRVRCGHGNQLALRLCCRLGTPCNPASYFIYSNTL